MEGNACPVYILNSLAEADGAVRTLRKAGVDARKLSCVDSLSALGGALAEAGISPDTAREFEAALGARKYLLVVRGNAVDMAMVNCVLASSTDLSNA